MFKIKFSKGKIASGQSSFSFSTVRPPNSRKQAVEKLLLISNDIVKRRPHAKI